MRVIVNFYSVDDLGNQESLNGKERSETNSNIRSVLGTYEDFVLTTLSIQNNNSGFIDMDQRNRKDLLSQFLDINVFETLYDIANTDIKEVATLVKEYQRQDFGTQLAHAITDIDTYSKEHKNYQIDKTELELKINELNDKILSLTSDLVPIDVSIENIDSLNELKSKVEKLITSLNVEVTDKQQELIEVDSIISDLKDELSKYNITTSINAMLS